MRSVITLFLLMASCQSSQALTTGQIREICLDQSKQAECLAYMDGLAEGFLAEKFIVTQGLSVCLPELITTFQVRDAFMSYLSDMDAGIEKIPPGSTAVLSFQKAFPCSAKK